MSLVYFIQAGDSGPVKIGFTTNLEVRLSSLATGASRALVVLRQIEGTRVTEKWLHNHFSERRQAGEWFTFCPTMLTVEPPSPAELPPPVRTRGPGGKRDDFHVDRAQSWVKAMSPTYAAIDPVNGDWGLLAKLLEMTERRVLAIARGEIHRIWMDEYIAVRDLYRKWARAEADILSAKYRSLLLKADELDAEVAADEAFSAKLFASHTAQQATAGTAP